MLHNVTPLVPDNLAETDAEDVSDDNILSPHTSWVRMRILLSSQRIEMERKRSKIKTTEVVHAPF